MHLIDLLPEESLALVALSRAIARADGAITPLEGRAIAVIAAELGEATYRRLFAKAAESFPIRPPSRCSWRASSGPRPAP